MSTESEQPGTPQPIAGGLTKRNVMPDYLSEDVLKHARDAFAETVALKVKQLRRFIPKKKEETNTDITGKFVEELVRGFISNWIGQQRLVTGTFYNADSEASSEKALQIDGIVHDPRCGPAIISEGNFEIVHPAFCSGVIEIKTTEPDLEKFEKRLRVISGRYMKHLTASSVMGVVVSSSDPPKDSLIPLANGGTHRIFNANLGGWCPIFVLFQEKDGDYVGYFEAIHAMIVAMHQLQVTTNYLW